MGVGRMTDLFIGVDAGGTRCRARLVDQAGTVLGEGQGGPANIRLGEAAVKGELVRSLLSGRASEATVLIASSVVQRPRERRVRQLLSRALRLVADERGRAVAIVHVAVEPSAEQLGRLTDMLGRRYGTEVALNVVVDPDIVGGLRIEIGDDVIDATVSSRLNDLRQRLAG